MSNSEPYTAPTSESAEDEETMENWVSKSFVVEEIDDNNSRFALDGVPFTPRSGEVNYFMIRPETWNQTFNLIKDAQLNCVTTAVEWALHEPYPGLYDFQNELDLKAYLELAFKKKLKVILKIGPQSSPDRELGGLPQWLLAANPKMRFRVQDQSFLFFFGRWLQKLYGVVQPCLTGNGGPIIMIQIEDAYGSYPINDRNYLYWLRDVNRGYVGDKALLYTSDFNDYRSIERGYIHGVLATVKFGTASEKKVADQFEGLKKFQPKGPLMNSQYWVGVPTYWKDVEYNKLDPEILLEDIADFVTGDIGFNLHVFRGGTNFGLSSGEREGKHSMTSYDCDAPISEAGDPTRKWALIKSLMNQMKNEEFEKKEVDVQREIIGKILRETEEPEASKKGEYGIIPMVPAEPFMKVFKTSCGKSCLSMFLKSMGEMNVQEGILAYTTDLEKEANKDSVLKGSVKDRAYVVVNMTELVGVIDDNAEFKLPNALPKGTRITFIVDNLGRGASQPGKSVSKGLFNMYLNNEYMKNWLISVYEVRGAKSIEKLHNRLRKKLRDRKKDASPANSSSELPPQRNTKSWWFANKNHCSNSLEKKEVSPPAFFYGNFVTEESRSSFMAKDRVHELDLESDTTYENLEDHLPDSFLNLSGWKKGIVYLNEWCLGRYWCVGPQQTLYVPGTYIRPYPGKNKITILEFIKAPEDLKVQFVPKHVYEMGQEVDLKDETSVRMSRPETARKDDKAASKPNLLGTSNGEIKGENELERGSTENKEKLKTGNTSTKAVNEGDESSGKGLGEPSDPPKPMPDNLNEKEPVPPQEEETLQ